MVGVLRFLEYVKFKIIKETAMEYPRLGSKIEYIRPTVEGEIISGVGMVKTIYLSDDKRPMVQVKDGENAWNIDLFCINPTDEETEQYGAMIAEVRRVSEEGNKKISILAAEYGEMVSNRYVDLFGEAIDLEGFDGE